MWGGISRRGATQIRIFTGIMDSIVYQEILKDHLKVYNHEIIVITYKL